MKMIDRWWSGWAIGLMAGLGTLVLALVSAPLEAQQTGSSWHAFSAPAVSVQATVTRAAGGVGVVHVADCIVARYAANTTAPAASTVSVQLRDGASGAGTVIWQQPVSLPATISAEAHPVTVCGLEIRGSANTAMTLEFSAATTNTFESVSLSGHDLR